MIQPEIIEIAKKNNPNFKESDYESYSEFDDDYEFFAGIFANSQSSKPNELGLAMNE